MTRQIPATMPHRPLASKADNDSGTSQDSDAIVATVSIRDDAGEEEQEQIIVDRQICLKNQAELLIEARRLQSELTKSNFEKATPDSYCELMSSSDYRKEGSLPLGVLIDKVKIRQSNDSLKFVCRVYAIGLRPKERGKGSEFVIYCDRFFTQDAPFHEMLSVMRQRSVYALAVAEKLTIPLARTAHSVASVAGEPCALPHITESEMLARGWQSSPDRMTIDTMNAKAAWVKEFLSNIPGEDIIKKVTGLNLFDIYEMVE